MIERLILGTANFGMNYGIANKKMIPEREVFNILEKSIEMGISTIDTARAYGNAEEIIGKFIKKQGKLFKVITKLPYKAYLSDGDVKKEIESSLNYMSTNNIDYLLLHSYKTFEKYGNTVLPVLEEYKERGIINHFGLSAYHTFEIRDILNSKHKISAVELPLNLFDRRFQKDNFLSGLVDSGIHVFIRSMFLQGLFFMKTSDLNDFFNPVKERINKIRNISDSYNLPIECMAMSYVLSNAINGVILGVDNVEQLEKNAKCLKNCSMDKINSLKDEIEALEILDEDIILPYKWRLN